MTTAMMTAQELQELNAKLSLVATRTVEVRESDGLVDTHIVIQDGDTLIVHATGQIWAGVWFTGLNGPRGWDNIDCANKFPLPCSHPFCLLGKLDNGYFYIGDTYRVDKMPMQGELYLEINDDVHGNGSGAFTAIIQVYR
jgi:hypothetical protein